MSDLCPDPVGDVFAAIDVAIVLNVTTQGPQLLAEDPREILVRRRVADEDAIGSLACSRSPLARHDFPYSVPPADAILERFPLSRCGTTRAATVSERESGEAWFVSGEAGPAW
jgi:hypothetical protein